MPVVLWVPEQKFQVFVGKLKRFSGPGRCFIDFKWRHCLKLEKMRDVW